MLFIDVEGSTALLSRLGDDEGEALSMTAHIGTSGWSYAHWEGVLYSPGTRPAARLELYAGRFATAELNASFYRWPADRTFARWRRRLPDGFQLSVKAARGLTHAKRLYAPEAWVERMAGCWRELADRRGVLLVQLAPGHVRFNNDGHAHAVRNAESLRALLEH